MIQPLFKNVMLRIEKVEESQSTGGLFIPASTNEADTFKATVVAIGPDVEHVVVDDLVVVTRYDGDLVTFEQQEYRLMSEEAILAKIVLN